MDTVIERILSLVEKCELNEKQILQKLEISNSSTISDWRNGKSKSPSIKNVIKFANFFGVSTDYLLTGSINSDTITKEEQEWLDLYRQLPQTDMYTYDDEKLFLTTYKKLSVSDKKELQDFMEYKIYKMQKQTKQ